MERPLMKFYRVFSCILLYLFVFFFSHFVLQHIISTNSLIVSIKEIKRFFSIQRNRKTLFSSEKQKDSSLFFLIKRHVINLYHDFLLYYHLTLYFHLNFLKPMWMLIDTQTNIIYPIISYNNHPWKFYLSRRFHQSFLFLFFNLEFDMMLNRIMGQIEILMGNDFFELLYGQMMIRKTINGCM